MSDTTTSPTPAPAVAGGSMRPADAAAYIGIPVRTLWYLAASDPSFPRPIKLSPRVTVFSIGELDRYIASRAAERRA